ncbi:MAG: chemotaxis protein CheW [Leptolyngbya sp. SIO3F4]|nr:chemotaxis protein CheW [Leptolyngbya sp. SIO3F4]
MRSQANSHNMLSFYLTPQIQAVISVDELIGLVTIETTNIVPIPDIPRSVMGIYSYRGDVMWIVDLPCLLGLTPLYLANTRQVCSIVFLQVEHQTAGFAIAQIGQMLTFDEKKLKRDYSNLNAHRLDWCTEGIYSKDKDTFFAMKGNKIFELLKVSEISM